MVAPRREVSTAVAVSKLKSEELGGRTRPPAEAAKRQKGLANPANWRHAGVRGLYVPGRRPSGQETLFSFVRIARYNSPIWAPVLSAMT